MIVHVTATYGGLKDVGNGKLSKIVKDDESCLVYCGSLDTGNSNRYCPAHTIVVCVFVCIIPRLVCFIGAWPVFVYSSTPP